jgi:lipocalin
MFSLARLSLYLLFLIHKRPHLLKKKKTTKSEEYETRDSNTINVLKTKFFGKKKNEQNTHTILF